MKLLLLLLSLACLMWQGDAVLSCRDEDNSELDWFTIYKLPKDSNSANPFIASGTAHAAITNLKESFTLSSRSLNDSESMPGRTLDILYTTDFTSPSNKLGYIIYNDQTPIEGQNDLDSRAHAKGILAFDDKRVFWLIHSVPRYPPPISNRKYKIAANQCKYGQSMLCMSHSISELNNILDQLLLAWPQIYDSFVPADVLASNERLRKLVSGDKNRDVTMRVTTLKTVKGQELTAFHKTSKHEKELYQNVVGSHFAASSSSVTIVTETWTNGVGTTPSICTCPVSVYNINTMVTPYLSFPNSKDHSKIAIVLKNKKPSHLCIGDINRQDSQDDRGGGTICIANKPNLAALYYSFIGTFDDCNKSEIDISKVNIC